MVRATIAAVVGFFMLASIQPLLAQEAPLSQEQIKGFVSRPTEAESTTDTQSAASDSNNSGPYMKTGISRVRDTKTANLAGAMRLPSNRSARNLVTTSSGNGKNGRPGIRRSYGGDRARLAGDAMDMRLSFLKSSSELTTEAQGQADRFADALIKYSGKNRFLIEGHTDSIGPRAFNRNLSEERARAVVDYLIRKGVAQDKLRAVGYASDRPRKGLRASDPSNRRVEIVHD
jgi:outer membrane protein OmpA-like peptidoglycan-associated protein